MAESASTVETPRKDPSDGARILRDHAEPYLARDRARPPQAAHRLAEHLHGDTLALRLLGRTIREHPVTVGGYRGALERVETAARFLDDSVPEVHRPLAVVCQMAMELLDTPRTARVRPLLSILSFLGADGVRVPMRRLDPVPLRGTMVDTGPDPLDVPGLELTVGVLAAHGFVNRRWVDDDPTVALHPLISEVVREWLGGDALRAAEAASVVLARGDNGDYTVEDAAYRAVLSVRERALGREHPDTLWTRHRLAWVLAQRGQYAKARTAYRKVLDAQRRALGAEHPDTLWTQAKLARLAAQTGELVEAEKGFREVLTVQTRVLGAEHPYTRLTREQLNEVLGRERQG